MPDQPEYKQPDLSIFGEEHIKRYLETDGREGYLWNDAPILLLTTRGRRTGQPRTSALIFGRDGDDLLVVASQGGMPKHPFWYLNLSDDPDVEVQVKGDRFAARAHCDRRREATTLEDHDDDLAELRRVPGPYRPHDPTRRAHAPVATCR